jgi:hypothetical protein
MTGFAGLTGGKDRRGKVFDRINKINRILGGKDRMTGVSGGF